MKYVKTFRFRKYLNEALDHFLAHSIPYPLVKRKCYKEYQTLAIKGKNWKIVMCRRVTRWTVNKLKIKKKLAWSFATPRHSSPTIKWRGHSSHLLAPLQRMFFTSLNPMTPLGKVFLFVFVTSLLDFLDCKSFAKTWHTHIHTHTRMFTRCACTSKMSKLSFFSICFSFAKSFLQRYF